MRDVRWVFCTATCGVAAMAAGCGSSHQGTSDAGLPDAPAVHDAAIDALPDAPACEKTLLVGGTDVVAQGWTVYKQNSAAVTYAADYTLLTTVTTKNPTSGTESGAQLLLARPSTFAADEPFKLEVVLQVDRVDNHNQYDAAVAIMGSLTGAVGVQTDRAEMIYIDGTATGWSDDSLSVARNALDGAYHTYVLSVNAARDAVLSIDGVVTTLVRSKFVTNGTIGVGDQTNEPNVEATIRIRSVRQLCAN